MDSVNIYTRKCIACGERGMVKHVDWQGHKQWKLGTPIQEALPDLTPDEREQLVTGTHPRCWTVMFGEEEDDGMDLEIITDRLDTPDDEYIDEEDVDWDEVFHEQPERDLSDAELDADFDRFEQAL